MLSDKLNAMAFLPYQDYVIISDFYLTWTWSMQRICEILRSIRKTTFLLL